jgi:probable F420-dependent oxidoreductase
VSGGLASVSVLLSNHQDAEELLGLALVAESCGFRRVWLAETGGLDAAGMGAVIARSTSLEIGTSIVPVYSRTPALLAMMAATWAQLGGGRRVHLGIGAGGQVIVERWHGVPFDKPATTTRETLLLLRQAFSGQRSTFDGATRRSDGFRLLTGAASSVSIYVGGMGPVMVSLAAELADGLIVTWLSPRVLSDFRAGLSKAVADHGRSPSAVTLVARAYVAVTETPEVAREAVRKELVEYLVSPPYARYFRSVGFESEVDEVTARFVAHDRAAAVAGVSDRLLDEVLVVGRRADDVRQTLRGYLEAGADDLMIQPVPAARGGDPRRTIEAVAEAFQPL